MSLPRAELTYRTSVRDANATGDGVRFRHPVNPGDVLSFRATVDAVWRTSIEVGVRVEAENAIIATTTHVLTAYLTMVAPDEQGAPSQGPSPKVDGPEASRRWREARLRRYIRLAAPPDLHELHAALHADKRDRALAR